MSTQTKQRIFVPGSSAKAREVNFGDNTVEILNVSFKAEDLGKFVKEHKNQKGYINLSIVPRKEKGQYGDTHSIQLDTWEPKQDGEESAPAAKPKAKAKAAPAKPAADDAEQDDIPF